MANIFQIGITNQSKAKIQEVESVEAITGKGLVNDRHFGKNRQITLIESEKIDNYNKLSGTLIPYLNFRRNIVTQGINLNELLGNEFFLGKVKVKATELCEPCKSLQDRLGQENLVKQLLHKAGIICTIINSGKIFRGDKILK